MQTSREVTENLVEHLARTFPEVDDHLLASMVMTIIDWHQTHGSLELTVRDLFFTPHTRKE